MSGGTKTTTQTAVAEPWEGAQPTLKTSLSAANQAFKNDDLWQPYTGSTVVPYADQTTAGMQNIQDRALSAMGSEGNPFDSSFNFFGNVFDNGGLSSQQQGVANQWANTASGAELQNTSPEFDNVLSRALGDASTRIDLNASGMGRYGSGEHMGVQSRELGNIASQARLGEYGRQLGRMDSARSNLANMGQQGITNQFGASQMLPGAWDARNAPARDMMNLGSMYEDLAARTMTDNQRIFDETRTAPLRAIEWLNAIGSGAGSLGGSNTATSQQPTPNPFLQVGAGLLGLNSLFR